MSDPSISREEHANETRAAQAEQARHDPGFLGTTERALSFVREQIDAPETVEEMEQLRRANDADQRS